MAYRYSNNTNVYAEWYFAQRRWTHQPCGGTFVRCDQGISLRNVLMHDEAVTSGDGVFPDTVYPSGISVTQGPLGSDLAAFFFAGLFYDVAHEAGLGVHKADLLFWKTLSVITDTNSFNTYTMRMFGSNVMDANYARPRPTAATPTTWPMPHLLRGARQRCTELPHQLAAGHWQVS